MSELFFTSDAHFGHANVIKYCKRPFENTSHMEQVLCDNWNKVVARRDTVYLIGDTFWANNSPVSRKKAEDILKRLNGNKVLLPGNHDARLIQAMSKSRDIHEVTRKGTAIVMCHYPIISWNKKYHGSICLHGHTHSPNKLTSPPNRLVNICVDAWDFTPASLTQIKELISTLGANN